ncbi:MAG: PP2C family protein-serine/threonine phosphatase [Lachnospiraceae bacterium]|nr:PP2C family protein-serine/threonine phosphatase [Lachnospiraceae bacterium]
MDVKKMRFSLGKKTVFIIVLMAVLLCATAVLISRYVFSRTNDETFRKDAVNLATTVSVVIDSERAYHLQQKVKTIYDTIDTKVGSEYTGTPEHDAYLANFSEILEDEDFLYLKARMTDIFQANDVESIYVSFVDPEGLKTVYIADASEDACPPGTCDLLFPQNRGVIDDPELGFPPYITNTEEYGWLVSAAVPLHAPDGQVFAYAFVDISMNDVRKVEHDFVLMLLALLAILTLVIILVYSLIVNRILVGPINRLSKAAADYYKDRETPEENSFADLDIRTGDEIENLSEAMKQMERDLKEYIRNLTAVTAEKERIGAELNVATQIQADMLPSIFPPFPDRHEFEIFATMDPAKEVGGDFYDFFLVDDDHLAMVMADVSGKGVPAALFMVIAKTLIKNRAQLGESPAQVLAEVNNQLCEGNEAELFVTVWLGILEISTGKGLAANAGHEHPTIRRAGGNYELVVYKHSAAVATMEGLPFKEHEFELHPGDSLFVYTDGVAEATDKNDELFGTDRMLDALNKNPDAAPEESLSAVRAAIDDFVGEAPQFDDITMLGFRYLGKNGKGGI